MPIRSIARRVFGTSGVESVAGDAALAALRAFVGFTFAFAHGLGKLPPSEQFTGFVGALGFPAPGLFAWCAALAEFLGGLLVAVGLATRPAAVAAAFTMAVAAFGAHASDPFAKKEPALLFLAVFAAFAVVGSGRFGLDALVRARLGDGEAR